MISVLTEQGLGCDTIILRMFPGASLKSKENKYDKEEDDIIDHYDVFPKIMDMLQ